MASAVGTDQATGRLLGKGHANGRGAASGPMGGRPEQPSISYVGRHRGFGHGDPFASAPWQPIQVPSAGLAVEADPHRARADSRSVDFIAGVNAQCAAQLGGRHCSVERGEDVVVYADLERLPPRFVIEKHFGQVSAKSSSTAAMV